jgi:hypothetical protein
LTHTKKVLCILFLIFSSSDSDSDDGEDQKGEKETGEKKVENANKDEAIEWLEHRACQPFRYEYIEYSNPWTSL